MSNIFKLDLTYHYMNLNNLNISPWILEKEDQKYRLRKYFKTNFDLMNYFSENNQFMNFIDKFEELEDKYRVQIALTDYLSIIGKFDVKHSKYPLERKIEKIMKDI